MLYCSHHGMYLCSVLYCCTAVGLASTYFDTSNGNDGLYWGMLHVPGFLTYLSPLSLGIAGLDWDAVGNGTATGAQGVYCVCLWELCGSAIHATQACSLNQDTCSFSNV